MSSTLSESEKKNLSDVVVLTTRKFFWESEECRIFPNILYTRILFGKSTDFINAALLFVRAVLYIIIRNPELVLIAAAPRLNSWFAILKKRGFLKNTRLACIGHLEFGYYLVPYFDRIFVYSTRECDIRETKAPVKGKYFYLPLPASRVEEKSFSENRGNFIFTGGRAKRDYKTLINAVKNLPVKLKIVTRDRDCVDWDGAMPENVELENFKPLDDFLQDIKDAKFVVIPLFREEEWSHGQTTIVQAMRLGKAVISNTEATVDDYITDGEDGILVEPEDESVLSDAIMKMLQNPDEVERLGCNAREKSEIFTDKEFARLLSEQCLELINQK